MDIIWINGMPRSGTSWLGQIFDSHPNVVYRLAPLFSYQFKNQVDQHSSLSEWDTFFEQVYQADDDIFINQRERRTRGEYPIFNEKKANPSVLAIKHTRFHNLTGFILKNLENIKFIHIIRNPCASISSWLKAPREFPQNLDPLLEWRNGKCRKTSIEEFWGFNDWIELTNYYRRLENEYPDRCLITRYETLVKEPVQETRRLFQFANLSFEEQTFLFLQESHRTNNSSEYAVYKNKDAVLNKWKTQLPAAIREEIYAELADTPLQTYLND